MAQSCMDDARPFPAISVGHVPAHLGLTWSYMAWARQGVPAPCHADSPGSWHTVYWLLKEQQENMQHLSWAAFLFIYLLENQSYGREEWECVGGPSICWLTSSASWVRHPCSFPSDATKPSP